MGWLSPNRKICVMQLDGVPTVLEHKKLKCGCRFRIICCLALPCDSTSTRVQEEEYRPELY